MFSKYPNGNNQTKVCNLNIERKRTRQEGSALNSLPEKMVRHSTKIYLNSTSLFLWKKNWHVDVDSGTHCTVELLSMMSCWL
jgi:hypothetical protein